MDDPKAIARGLTREEAYILIGDDDAPEDWDPVDWTDEVGARLVALGLAIPIAIETTDLGRSVAEALREMEG